MLQVLLICDDAQEEALLSFALQRVSVEMSTVHSIDEALSLWETHPADMVVLAQHRDSPLAAAQRLRAVTVVPLLLITDELPEDEQVRLVEEGKAILITRPYSMRLLMSQIPLLLQQSDGVPRAALELLTQGEVVLNPIERSVRVGEQPPRFLSKLEFTLLFVLMQHAGQVLPPETLIEQVWGYEAGDKRMLQNLVLRLRKKVEPNPHQPRYLLTVSDVGYRFRGEEDEHNGS